jgi:hypothetical protein
MALKTLFSSIFVGLCALCILSIDTEAQVKKPGVQRTSTYVTASYAYKLTNQDFVNTPSWNPNDGEPPISFGRAIGIARENLSRFVTSAEAWKMRTVLLQSLGGEKWYYRIHFFCSGVACREIDIENRNFTALVKMDGTIVEPKKVTIEN